MSTRIAEINWEMIVAYATPSMAMPKPTTKRRSRPIFMTLERQRKYSGRFVSPTARRIALPMLYTSRPKTPEK